MAIDPVCDMEVDVQNPPGGKTEYKGETYYFCAPGCKRVFERDPEKYLSGQGQEASHQEQSMGQSQQKTSFFARIFGRKS
ncbi:MAG: YHS domain-containing protein [Dehalococcoidia bacterium]|nr:YHS domain-containing protein [Dehalococcoidia bacterium]